MVGPQYELKDYRIALEGKRERGWGRVSIPPTRIRPTTISTSSSTNRRRGKPSSLPRIRRRRGRCSWRRRFRPTPRLPAPRSWCRSNNWRASAWETGLAAAVAGSAAAAQRRQAGAIVRRAWRASDLPSAKGPRPPRNFLGTRWGERGWTAVRRASVETWRGDQDLLTHALSGQSLPVGDLKVRRHCKVCRASLRRLPHCAAARRCWLAVHDGPRRRLFFGDHAGGGRLFAGVRRRRSLRGSAASDGIGSRGSRQHPKSDRRPSAGRHLRDLGSDLAGGEGALIDRIPVPPGSVPGRRTVAGRQSLPSPRTRRRCWTIRAWPGLFRMGWTLPALTIALATSRSLVEENMEAVPGWG